MAVEKTIAGASLAEVLDRVLDKGLVINADICVSLAGVELLGIKIRAALASFETAARYGLEFPSGTNYEKAAWKELIQRFFCWRWAASSEREKTLLRKIR